MSSRCGSVGVTGNMRIAMVGPFGFRPKKTMRARAFPLAQALTARGHQVALFMPPWHTPAEAGRRWHEAGVAVRYIPLGGGPLRLTRRLIRETLAWQPDVVHCFKPKAYSGLTAAWVWLARRRPRLALDADDWEGWGGWNDLEAYPRLVKHFFAWQESWGMRHNHLLTVASRALQTLAWGLGCPPERVVYLPNGPGIVAPPHPLGAGPDGPPTLLLYTRFFEFDPARLARIVAQVYRQIPTLQALLVGASLREADGARFEGEMRALDAWACVRQAGWLAEEALPAALAQAHVGLYLMDDTLLNRAKCPVKLADMLAVGLPVVGEAVGQVPEYVVHRQTGWLCASGDEAGVAEGVMRLLGDSAERARLSRQAQQHLRSQFAWEHLAARLEAAYAALPSP